MYLKKRLSVLKRMLLEKDFNLEKAKLLWKINPYTLMQYPALNNIYEICCNACSNNTSGDFIECGTYKAGSTAIMGFVSNKFNQDRKIWGFDSFEGVPDDFTEKDGQIGRTSYLSRNKKINVASKKDAKEIFEKVGIKKYEFVKGLFDNTLPKTKKRIEKIAVLRLDADLYTSTMCVLNELFPLVAKGGYIIFDDYYTIKWKGVKEAVKDYFGKTPSNIKRVSKDSNVMWMQKQ